MKIIFAGTPDIAISPLKALLASSHQIIAVYTQPDRPAGRGKKLVASPVKQLALQHNIPVEQPENFKSDASRATLKNYHADIMIVMAYGLILPVVVLETPKYGCINIHVSLLPRWRGAAPVQHAILVGDKETGVTIMQMDKGLDTGAILAQESCIIEPQDTTESLYAKLSAMAPSLVLNVLDGIDQISPLCQDNSLATYAHKIEKQDAKINWYENSQLIDRKVRAYYPAPIVFFEWQGELVRIWQGYPLEGDFQHLPGEMIDINKQGVVFKTLDGAYCITCLQFSGKNPLSGHALVNAWKNRFS